MVERSLLFDNIPVLDGQAIINIILKTEEEQSVADYLFLFIY